APTGGASPFRGLERARPGGSRRFAVDHAPRRLDRHTRRRVKLAERLAPAPRCAARIDSAQFEHKLRQIGGRLAFVVKQVIAIGLAIDPAIDRPGGRVGAGRLAPPDPLPGAPWYTP